MSTQLIFALVCAAAAILYGAFSVQWILAKPSGSARMQEIASAIQEGAKAYLNRQYTTIGMAGIVVLVLIGIFIGWPTAIGFAIGAVFSGMAGYIGMNISVRSNVRTAEAASRSLSAAAPSPACWWLAWACWGSRVTTPSCWAWAWKIPSTRWSAWLSVVR